MLDWFRPELDELKRLERTFSKGEVGGGTFTGIRSTPPIDESIGSFRSTCTMCA